VVSGGCSASATWRPPSQGVRRPGPAHALLYPRASRSALITAAASPFNGAANALPSKSPGPVPVTLGPSEPFTTTITVCLYFSLLICLPLLPYEVLAFVKPGLTPREKSVVLPVIWVTSSGISQRTP
jgi:Sec-independent protein secretion pathway component TatC